MRTSTKKILLILTLSLSLSCFALTGCGNAVSAEYIAEHCSHEELELYSNHKVTFYTNYGVFHGKYKWNNEDESYLFTLEPEGLWPETIYTGHLDEEGNIILSGFERHDIVFYHSGKPDKKPNSKLGEFGGDINEYGFPVSR